MACAKARRGEDGICVESSGAGVGKASLRKEGRGGDRPRGGRRRPRKMHKACMPHHSASLGSSQPQ